MKELLEKLLKNLNLCGFNYENKSIEYCDYKYSDDYVIENRRKYDCFNF